VLRIEIHRPEPRRVSFSLSGDFCSSAVADVTQLIDEARQAGERVAIDLSAVRRVDREAVRFLALRGGRDADLVGCPGYVREWILCESRRSP
jgi:ABC-type transporter Mla MlaB component